MRDVLRHATPTERPLGSQHFVQALEELTSRPLSPRKGGRPRKPAADCRQSRPYLDRLVFQEIGEPPVPRLPQVTPGYPEPARAVLSLWIVAGAETPPIVRLIETPRDVAVTILVVAAPPHFALGRFHA